MINSTFSPEDLFSSFFDTSPVCMWIKDTSNNLIKLNKAASILEGKPAEELEGRSCYEIYPEERAKAFWEDDLEVIKTGQAKLFYYEPHVLPFTNQVKWLQVNKMPIRKKNGSIYGVMVYAFDVTDIKEAEAQTRESEQYNKLLMDIAPFPIAISSLEEEKFLYVNESAANVFNMNVEDTLKENPEVFYAKKDQRDKLRQALDNGEEVKDQEIEFRRKSGEIVYGLISAVKINHKGVNYSYNVFNDITKLKKNEMELSRMFEEFRLVFENSNDAFFWADSTTGKLINCNRSAEELLRMSREQLIGKDHWEIHPKKDKELYVKLFKNIGRTHSEGMELEIEDADGNIVPVSISISTVSFEHRSITQATIRNISERIENEKALKESEEKYRAVVSNAPVVFIEISCDGTIILLEGKGLNQLNFFPQKMIGESIYNVLKNFPQYIENINKALHGESLEFTMDFETSFFDTYFSPVKDGHGNITSIIGVAVDIADKRKADLKLSYEKNLLSTLIDIIPDLIYAKDSQSRFLVGNKKVADLFGLGSSEELIGKTDFDFFPEAEAREFFDEEQELLASRISMENKEIMTVKESGVVYHEITKIPFYGLKGEVIGLVGISKDITERKKAEAAIRESELKYRHMAENMNDVLWQLSPDMIFLYLSPSFYNLTGFSPSEYVGKSLWDIMTEESANDLRRQISVKRYNSGEYDKNGNLVFESTQLHKNKTVIWTEISSNPVFDSDGELLYYQGVTRDITQRKLAELALKESQEKLGVVIANAPIVLFQIDSDGIFRFSEGKGLERLGLKPGQVVGLSVFEVYKDYPEICVQVDAALKGEIVRAVINVNNIYFEIQYNPIIDHDGQVTSIIGIALDITERKLAEEALLESETRFSTLFHEMTEAVAMHKLVFNEKGEPVNYEILEINPAYYKQTGLAYNEIVNRLITEVFNLNEPPFLKELADVAMFGKKCNIETYYEPLERHLKISAISPGKNKFATVIEDVTAQKKYEKELKNKNEELERFTYTVSHDLKSPLVTIKGFVGMLEQDIANQNEANIADDINRIKSATDKMTSLLSDLLQLSRVGRIINPPVFVSMNTIINDAVELVSGLLNERNVNVIISKDLPDVYVDKQRIVEVWQNLIENAVKFLGEQQKPEILINYYKEDTKFIFSILDNGVGIDRKYFNTVFGLFNKLDNKSEGTGIGLALVRRIVEVHGGEIWVESEGLGKGAKFSFSIPCKSGKNNHKPNKNE